MVTFVRAAAWVVLFAMMGFQFAVYLNSQPYTTLPQQYYELQEPTGADDETVRVAVRTDVLSAIPMPWAASVTFVALAVLFVTSPKRDCKVA